MTAELEGSTAFSLFLVSVPSSPQTGTNVVVAGSGQVKVGEVNPGLLIPFVSCFKFSSEGRWVQGPRRGDAAGEQGRLTLCRQILTEILLRVSLGCVKSAIKLTTLG